MGFQQSRLTVPTRSLFESVGLGTSGSCRSLSSILRVDDSLLARLLIILIHSATVQPIQTNARTCIFEMKDGTPDPSDTTGNWERRSRRTVENKQ